MKLSLFAADLIVCMENPIDSTKKLIFMAFNLSCAQVFVLLNCTPKVCTFPYIILLLNGNWGPTAHGHPLGKIPEAKVG